MPHANKAFLPAILFTLVFTFWFIFRSSSSPSFGTDVDELVLDAPDHAPHPVGDGPIPGSAAHRIAVPPRRPVLKDHLPEPEELWEALMPQLRWMNRQPILSHRESLAVESVRCKKTELQSNLDQLAGEGSWWSSVSERQLQNGRTRVAAAVAEAFGFDLTERKGEEKDTSLSNRDYERLFGDGRRGLVFTAGNKDTAKRLLSSLKMLRKHGCTLPAEIFSFPGELDGSQSVKSELEALGGVTFRLVSTQQRSGSWKQFQLKGEAVARSSFSEVLYLDSDNIAVRDPTFLFDAPSYKQTGVVLWPDLTKDSPSNAIFRTLSMPCDPEEWQIDSGQMLFSKTARSGLNLAALFAAEAMQQDSDFWFHMSGGDKDTFRYAFHFLSLPFTAAPHWVSLGGSIIATFHGHQFCGHTMIQYGLSGAEWKHLDGKFDADYTPTPPGHAPPLFLHANLLKHSGGFNLPGSTWETLKSADPDLIRNPKSPLLRQDIRGRAYNHRGMCADLWDAEASAREGTGTPYGGAFETGRFAMWDFQETWGGLMRDTERIYYHEAGGIGGAW